MTSFSSRLTWSPPGGSLLEGTVRFWLVSPMQPRFSRLPAGNGSGYCGNRNDQQGKNTAEESQRGIAGGRDDQSRTQPGAGAGKGDTEINRSLSPCARGQRHSVRSRRSCR